MPGQAKILSSKEIADVFKLLTSSRDNAIFALGVYTGMRISEIVSLKRDQVFTQAGFRSVLVIQRLKKRSTVYSEIPVTLKANLLAGRLPAEAQQACEHAFGYVENLSNVIEPDDFLGDCYHSIIQTWLKALHQKDTPPSQIVTRLFDLQDRDQYEIFCCMDRMYADEMGKEVLKLYRKRKSPAKA